MAVLVIGATGKQGGATARALLDRGVAVRALVRDTTAATALALRERGAELVRGDLDDPASLLAAARGVDGVFSIPFPDLTDLQGDAELRRGRHLVEAARRAGVPQFVHSSVAGAGDFHRNQPGWAEGRWDRHYWESKAEIDELVRTGGFARWTVLKPATFMENLLEKSFLFGDWSSGTIVTGFAEDTRIAWIAVDDIGAAAATAFTGPGTLDGKEVELAGDMRTMTEVAAILSEVTGRTVTAPVLTPQEAVTRGLPPFMIRTVEQINENGTPARPEIAQALGLPTTDFRTWARRTFA
ncbi:MULTISPECIES: NmrA/HSCARG family protein [unclassified Micromonospora]|uniref:NmrA/HSCARG family protein n=1 Tax=unclassified Micromonospora TaxID=2617518 RepID=UPI001033C876|nr:MULTISPECIES: NmrA/HSCARG family protein [unclassified Micromonospora]QKW13704.1 NmrA/HSCARG family protein [Verrucosispora sp. NA02020]TBL36482.1 NmrA/HSCARG family protein [Verrucosispora sp. SN26_14.1]